MRHMMNERIRVEGAGVSEVVAGAVDRDVSSTPEFGEQTASSGGGVRVMVHNTARVAPLLTKAKGMTIELRRYRPGIIYNVRSVAPDASGRYLHVSATRA